MRPNTIATRRDVVIGFDSCVTSDIDSMNGVGARVGLFVGGNVTSSTARMDGMESTDAKHHDSSGWSCNWDRNASLLLSSKVCSNSVVIWRGSGE